jgi:hypothetical protein
MELRRETFVSEIPYNLKAAKKKEKNATKNTKSEKNSTAVKRTSPELF